MRMSKENYDKFMKGINMIVENASDEDIEMIMDMLSHFAEFMAKKKKHGKK